MESFMLSDPGIARELNEDSFGEFLSKDGGVRFFVVADGMGGHLAGEVASAMAVSLFGEAATGFEYTGEESLRKFLTLSIVGIDAEIKEQARNSEQCSNMGTTAVIYAAAEDYGLFCNVGDSRGYLVSGKNMAQITRDHSLVQSMVDNGYIFHDDSQKNPFSNAITKALGFLENPEEEGGGCDLFKVEPKSGDVVLLCSDGLSNMLSGAEMLSIIKRRRSLKKAAEVMIKEANDRGGPDNITVSLVKYDTEVSSVE